MERLSKWSRGGNWSILLLEERKGMMGRDE